MNTNDPLKLLLGSPVADDLRNIGWAVAVHNDYQLNGQSYTFWLFTKRFRLDYCTRAVKGEGRTDGDALDQIRRQVAQIEQLYLP
jgi:hypothetical protein